MDLHSTGDLAKIAIAAVGGGGLAKLLDVLIVWRRGKAAETPAMIKAGAEMQHAVSEAAKDLLEDYRRQLGFVRDRCDALQADLDQARSDLARSLQEHASCRTELELLRGEIDELKAQAALFTAGGEI